MQAATEKGVGLGEVISFESVTGKGVRGIVDGRPAAFGNAALLSQLGVSAGDSLTRAEELARSGATVIFGIIDGKFAGLAAIADPIKQTTPEALRALHAEGVRVVMLTGDSQATADAVARQLGIDEVVAGCFSPDGKAQVIQRSPEG